MHQLTTKQRMDNPINKKRPLPYTLIILSSSTPQYSQKYYRTNPPLTITGKSK